MSSISSSIGQSITRSIGELGAETWVNPAATINSPWIYEGNEVYSIDGTQGGTTLVVQAEPNITGKDYLVEYDVTDYVAGTIRIGVGNANTSNVSANGSYSETITALSTAASSIQALVGLNGKVANITIKRVIN